MGCNKICQAKKKAKKAEKQAAAASRQARAAAAQAAKAQGAAGASVSSSLITVATLLDVEHKWKALDPNEMRALIKQGNRIPKIAKNGQVRTVAGSLNTQLWIKDKQKYLMTGIAIARMVAKVAAQINDVIFNFASIAELIADIAVLLLKIAFWILALMISIYAQMYFTAILGTKILTKFQMKRLKKLVDFSKIKISGVFNQVLVDTTPLSAIQDFNDKEAIKLTLNPDSYEPNTIDFNGLSNDIAIAMDNSSAPFTLEGLGFDEDQIKEDFIEAFEDGFDAMKNLVLDNLAEALDDPIFDVAITDIDADVASMDADKKVQIKNLTDDFVEANKKIEILQAGELLDQKFSVSGFEPTEEGQVFDDNDLAVAAAEKMIVDLKKRIENAVDGQRIDAQEVFLLVFTDEVNKKKNQSIELNDNLLAANFAAEIIIENKFDFVNSMVDSVAKINLDNSGCVVLDPCYEAAISNQFTDLKTTTQTQQTAFINASTVNTTQDMITLRDSVYANVQQAVNDAIITVDPDCQQAFGESVCKAIECFKSRLYGEIKTSVESGSLSINDVEVPDGISKYELKKMLDIFLVEIKKKLIAQAYDIIVQEVLPCKSCKPCEDMVADMGIYTSKSIQKSKENIIKHVQGQIINNTSLDWTITDAQSIIDKKNLLISNLNMALLRDAGELALVDDMLFRLKAEEKELIKNIKTALSALATEEEE